MDIQNLSENVILVELSSSEPAISNELKKLNGVVFGNSNSDVIVDFTDVEIINSSNISNLLILRGYLRDKGHQLILCNVQTITKCIFVVARLSECFEFADNKNVALENLQTAGRKS